MSKPKLFTSILNLFLLQFYGFFVFIFSQVAINGYAFNLNISKENLIYISVYLSFLLISFLALLVIFSLLSLIISRIRKNQFRQVFGKIVKLSIWILGTIYSIFFLLNIYALSQGGFKQMLLP
jgi:hypothetical protein